MYVYKHDKSSKLKRRNGRKLMKFQLHLDLMLLKTVHVFSLHQSALLVSVVR